MKKKKNKVEKIHLKTKSNFQKSIDRALLDGIDVEIILTKEEATKLKSPPIILKHHNLTKENIISDLKSILDHPYKDMDKTLNFIKSEIGYFTKDEELKRHMLNWCKTYIEPNIKNGNIGVAIYEIYVIGKNVMLERVRDHIKRKYKGNEFDSREWADVLEKLYKDAEGKPDDYTSDKMRKKYAYDEMNKPFQIKYPGETIDNDTKRKYWKEHYPERFKK